MKTLNRYGAFILTATAWLALDLFTKFYVTYIECCSLILVPDWLYLSLQQNTGIAFGIQLPFWVQVIGAVIIMGILIHYGWTTLFKQPKKRLLNQILLGIIIGGALGNLINRLALGYVIDFIVLKPFPVFNIADIGVTIGLTLLAISQFLPTHQK